MKDISGNSLQIKSTNYLSPQLFYNKFLDNLVMLDEFHSDTRPSAMDANHFYWAARIQYGSALRISEVLVLMPSDFDLNHRILTLRHTKTGKGKIQKTSILPYDVMKLEKFLESHDKDETLFKCTRSTMWRYYKNASLLGGMNLFEAKDIINIEGAWTHLLRSSCAKMYEDLGAKESLIAKKLRHSPGRSVTARYTKIDLGTLLDWDWEHLQEIPKF